MANRRADFLICDGIAEGSNIANSAMLHLVTILSHNQYNA